MTYCRNTLSFILFCIFLTPVVATLGANGYTVYRCSGISRCPGPVEYYESLNCTPIFKDGECCPWFYNCDHLYDLKYKQKCYFNGYKYEIGERIREEDANLCGEICICESRWNDFADFNCTIRENCPAYRPSRSGCFKGHCNIVLEGPLQCCPDLEICQLKRSEGCYINEKRYLPGDFFEYTKYINYICKCVENSEGSYEPVCIELNQWLNLDPAHAFYKTCAPVYLRHESGIRRHTWRCYKAGDSIINKDIPPLIRGPLSALHCPHNQSVYNRFLGITNYTFEDGGCLLVNLKGPWNIQPVTYGLVHKLVCTFGEITMQIGEQLNRIAYGNDSCIICICDLAPAPTCVVKENQYC